MPKHTAAKKAKAKRGSLNKEFFNKNKKLVADIRKDEAAKKKKRAQSSAAKRKKILNKDFIAKNKR
jgi:hypothetical protein